MKKITYKFLKAVYRYNPVNNARALVETAKDLVHRFYFKDEVLPELTIANANQILQESIPFVQTRKRKRIDPKQNIFPVESPLLRWQADLFDLSSIQNILGVNLQPYRYVLIAIDVFSKFVLVFPLINKSKEKVLEGIKFWFETLPEALQIKNPYTGENFHFFFRSKNFAYR
jgi:transposase InsO family protein